MLALSIANGGNAGASDVPRNSPLATRSRTGGVLT
jgi:hypothetical protein